MKIEFDFYLAWWIGVTLIGLGSIFAFGFAHALIVGGSLVAGSALVFKLSGFLAENW